LKHKNIDVSPNTVLGLLYEMNYSLQANRKTREGNNHPDRNKQFVKRFIVAVFGFGNYR
jgi:hypothetical protein